MKQWIAYILSLAVALPPLSAEAQEPTRGTPSPTLMEVQLPAENGHPSASLKVIEVPESEQLKVAASLRGQEGAVFLTGGHDPVTAVLDPRTDQIISATKTADAQALPHIEDHRILEKSHANRKMGILIALVPASGYGSYFWFLSNDYLTAAGGFAWIFLLNAAIGVFQKQWLSVGAALGNRTSSLGLWIASRFGKVVGDTGKARLHRFGEFLTAYGLNVVSANILFGLEGGDRAALYALVFALYASHETFDYISEKVFPARFGPWPIWTRQMAFALIEILIMNGSHAAEIFAGVVIPLGTLAYVFQENVARGLERIRVPFRRMAEFTRARKTSCVDLLKAARSRIRPNRAPVPTGPDPAQPTQDRQAS